jgi:hypothetical protein
MLRACSWIICLGLATMVHGQAVRPKQLTVGFGFGAAGNLLRSDTSALRGLSASYSTGLIVDLAISANWSVGFSFVRADAGQVLRADQWAHMGQYQLECARRIKNTEQEAWHLGFAFGPSTASFRERGGGLPMDAASLAVALGLRYYRRLHPGWLLWSEVRTSTTGATVPMIGGNAALVTSTGEASRQRWAAHTLMLGCAARF